MKKRMIYQVYVGQPSALYDRCVSTVAAYCKKYHIDDVVQREPILKIQPDMIRTGRSEVLD